MRIVSLAGPKGSGKNTLADLVQRHLEAAGFTCEQHAFADPIRWACDGLGIPQRLTRDGKDEPTARLGGKTGRDMLVAIGEATRGVSPDFFADHMVERLTVLADAAGAMTHAIVTDTRRANELDALERLATADDIPLARLWVSRAGHDADEVLEDIRARCVVITNDGTLEDLNAKAMAIAEWMATGRQTTIGGAS